MSRLQLLSLVIPAFGALARESIEGDIQNASLSRDSADCYSDIVNVGQVLSISCGEWTSGLREEVLDALLEALESRLPKPDALSRFIAAYTITSVQEPEAKRFEKLSTLAKSIELQGLGGYDECASLLGHTRDRVSEYLKLLGKNFQLFHKSERMSERKRNKFLRPVRLAAKHLLNVYFNNCPEPDMEELKLSQHPGGGVKETTNKICGLLHQHWQCQCVHRAARPYGPREARISLNKHQNLVLKVSKPRESSQSRQSTKFEILLPVCKDSIEWKVTSIEAANPAYSRMKAGDGLKAVDSDLCQWLLKSHGFQVDFLVDRDRLWHLTPRLSEDADHHTSMKSLQQLLGDDVLMAEISTYTPKEKLILCYILANSLLFFYPGTWLKSSWGSDKVYFLPQVNSSKPLILTMPYLSVDLHQAHTRQRSLRDHMQVHSHPVILDLGIIFLEIATGIKFVSKSHHSVENEWEQCNSDVRQAWQQFQDLEKLSEYDSSKRISPTLRKVISSCIKLEPPPNFPCNSLSEEGPIRQYILSCIVQPLASELKDGHQVRLENLHLPLSPEKGTEKLSVSSMQHLTASCRPTASQSLTPSRELPKQHTIATVTCPIRRDEFEIAVVCALPLEYDAVTLAFDEFWEDEGDRYGKAPGDPNTYTTGRIGQYNVVLALLPNMGKVRAASATASLRSSYAGLRLALLTGICGGVPGSDPENEIILGDVIISKTIIQYDFGRRYPDGFVPKDTRDDNLGRSNTDIRSFVSKFETSHGNKLLRYKASRVLAHIQEKAVKKQDRVRYGRPVASEDKLFKPGYLHKHRGQSEDRCCESACQAAQAASCDELCCDPAQLVARKRLRQIQELERNGMLSDSKVFEIHVGCMGSGDTVMKSGEDRDMIAKKYGIMAFEMEGAGVWDEVPCIIVKGVCDYADCHKNKKWQAYAAATAASVMKALLAYYGRTDKPAG